MSKLSVIHKHRPTNLREEFQDLRSRIAHRAFEIFATRGGSFGRELEDWCRAEREFLKMAPIEITEAKQNLSVRIELPGFKPEEIEVFVQPQSITIKGEKTRESTGKDQSIRYSEIQSGRVLREFGLPCGIVPEKTRAEMKDGILTLSLPKEKTKRVKVELAKASSA